jgi:hypothetical protein
MQDCPLPYPKMLYCKTCPRAVQHEQQIDGVRIINPFKVGDIGDLLA